MVLDIETAPVDKLLKSKKSFEAFLKFHNQASKQVSYSSSAQFEFIILDLDSEVLFCRSSDPKIVPKNFECFGLAL